MFSAVRAYFRTILESIGFTEWKTAFSHDNIPSTLIDRAYHLTTGTITSAASNHQVHAFDYNLTLRVFLKGYRDSSDSVDDAIIIGQDIVCELLNSSNRLGADIKDVILNSFEPIPLAADNDNSVILEFAFTIKLFINFN